MTATHFPPASNNQQFKTHIYTRTRTYTQDHDTFLKREAMLRMAAEKEVELKSNEVEALHLELLQVRQKSP